MAITQVADPAEAVVCLVVWVAVEVSSAEACLEAAWEAMAVVCKAGRVVVCFRVALESRTATTTTSNRRNMMRRSRRYSPMNSTKDI